MKKKIYVLPLAIALVLGLVAFISGSVGRSAMQPSGNALAALPASDIVVTVDTQRLLSETLPVIFADNPGLLAKVNGKIEKFNKEMGIDLRTFDSVAVGLRFAPSSANDFDAVVIARGHFNANQVIDAGFTAAKSKNEFQKEEEQYEGKTIFVVVPRRRAVRQTNANVADGGDAGTLRPGALKGDKESAQYEARIEKTSDKMAIVALDANTLAAGDLKSVKAAIDASMGRERVDDELVRMATQNPSALVGFSGRIPQSVTEKLAAGNKGAEAKYMASIRQFYGSFSTTGTDSETFVAVRTENAAQARDISQALNAMKLLSGFSVAQPSKGEIRSLAGVLKNLSITAQDNEVQIKLNINQKDLAPFVRGF